MGQAFITSAYTYVTVTGRKRTLFRLDEIVFSTDLVAIDLGLRSSRSQARLRIHEMRYRSLNTTRLGITVFKIFIRSAKND